MIGSGAPPGPPFRIDRSGQMLGLASHPEWSACCMQTSQRRPCAGVRAPARTHALAQCARTRNTPSRACLVRKV